MIENLQAGAAGVWEGLTAHPYLAAYFVAAALAVLMFYGNARFWRGMADDWQGISEGWESQVDDWRETARWSDADARKAREALRDLRLAYGDPYRMAARHESAFPYDPGAWAVALADLHAEHDRRLHDVVGAALMRAAAPSKNGERA